MNRFSWRLVRVFLAVVFLAAVAVCTSGCAPLDGTAWLLAGWSLSDLEPAEFGIRAEFKNGRVSGNSGVNTYSGTYNCGPGSAFEVNKLAVTLMAGPERAMRAESVYLALLEEAESFEVTGDRLLLHDGSGNPSLVFEVMSSQGSAH